MTEITRPGRDVDLIALSLHQAVFIRYSVFGIRYSVTDPLRLRQRFGSKQLIRQLHIGSHIRVRLVQHLGAGGAGPRWLALIDL